MFEDLKNDLEEVRDIKKNYDLNVFKSSALTTYVILKNVVPMILLTIFAAMVVFVVFVMFAMAPVATVILFGIIALILVAAFGETIYYYPEQTAKRKNEKI